MSTNTLDLFMQSLDTHVRVLNKILMLVPDEKINFRPTDESQSISEIVCHIFSVAQTHAFAVRDHISSQEHARTLYLDPDSVRSSAELIAHGAIVSQAVREALKDVHEEHLEDIVTYPDWGNFQTTAARSLHYFVEELIHHRGQLTVYLRLLGIKPPFLYDYS